VTFQKFRHVIAVLVNGGDKFLYILTILVGLKVTDNNVLRTVKEFDLLFSIVTSALET